MIANWRWVLVKAKRIEFFFEKIICAIRAKCESPFPMNTAKIIHIKVEFNSITEALKASGMDISYNPQLAMQRAKELDNDPRGKVERVMIDEANRILFVYKCDISILNEFQPFHSIMDDSPFQVVAIQCGKIHVDKTLMPRTMQFRRLIAKMGWTVTTL